MTTEADGSTRTALVVGVTGITGAALAERLVSDGWTVHGVSRSAPLNEAVRHVQADVLDSSALRAAMSDLRPSHVFLTVWSRQESEAENIRVNGGIVRDVLEGLAPAGSVKHCALVTGLKHYIGPFEAYGLGEVRETPFHEEEPRLPYDNFYYAQEDEVFAAAEKQGFTWSVHRSHTVIGNVTGNAMNMVLTLGAAAALCTRSGRKLYFPGNDVQWNGLTDMTDASVMADQLVWASTADGVQNEAYNIVNGDVFRWRWMWPRVTALLGVEAEPFDGTVRPVVDQMAGLEDSWPDVVREFGLRDLSIDKVASWWHTDSDLGRPIECLTDMSKSRKAGFLAYRCTLDSFTEAIRAYRDAGVLP